MRKTIFRSHDAERRAIRAEAAGLSVSRKTASRVSDLAFRQTVLNDIDSAALAIDSLEERIANAPGRPPVTWPEGFGHFLAAVRLASAYPETRVDPRLAERGAAGSTEIIPAEGGFLINRQFIPGLMARLYQTGEILSRCMTIPITNPNSDGLIYSVYDESSRANGSRMGGVQAFWQNQADAAIGSRPRFGRGELTAKKLTALVYLTDELVQDTNATEIFVTDGFAKEMAFVLENAIVVGDGADRPMGVTNSPALIKVPKETGQAAGTILAQNVTKAFARMWAPSRKTAIWLVNPEAEQLLLQLTIPVGTGGSAIPLYVATSDPDEHNLMLGRPVIAVEHCPVAGNIGDLMFCDFSRYILTWKQVMTAAVSIHVRFLTNEQAFRFVMRVDGQTIDQRPITPLNGTFPVSPFACLDVR